MVRTGECQLKRREAEAKYKLELSRILYGDGSQPEDLVGKELTQEKIEKINSLKKAYASNMEVVVNPDGSVRQTRTTH